MLSCVSRIHNSWFSHAQAHIVVTTMIQITRRRETWSGVLINKFTIQLLSLADVNIYLFELMLTSTVKVMSGSFLHGMGPDVMTSNKCLEYNHQPVRMGTYGISVTVTANPNLHTDLYETNSSFISTNHLYSRVPSFTNGSPRITISYIKHYENLPINK